MLCKKAKKSWHQSRDTDPRKKKKNLYIIPPLHYNKTNKQIQKKNTTKTKIIFKNKQEKAIFQSEKPNIIHVKTMTIK
ncbi:hypothetical protein Q6261_27135, partial [Klebsiella pneumoniae]|uniref:hypothetical protein n=1 Tax=Klebsiella pneumoniae TaxID=573 RepID=UPI002731D14D